MRLALREAEQAFDIKEVPVGAVIMKGSHLIGRGHNQMELLTDPTAHAEIIAITAAASFLEDWRLEECTLYVTKEPCAMCAGAIINSRLEKVVFGCYDEQEGCCGSLYQICSDPRFSHKTAVKGGILENDCSSLLVNFFKSRR
ncbi:MAG TPA: nucleoside deaminase [Candidatus Marinimicrobia bacterium]|nr:nucleoside deaminase [Candidatus Neomarinimicrobiota bacterium]HIC51596.1 nucleoside deaminase [Candidatus Neomarinimicrobiota bacterium]